MLRVTWYLFLISVVTERAFGSAVLYENGYEGIVVAIGDQVEQNDTIVANIKRMFQEGSKILYEATRHRAYFREVTIVVPATWKRKDEYMQTQSSGWLSDAEIRIDKPHPAYGSEPYTLQLGGCGEPADYTHLADTYATEMYSQMLDKYGPPGTVLVHEWAHLRWGVFDEYGTQGTFFPAFYIGEDLQVHSTGCTEGLMGWLLQEDGNKCQADTTGLPDSKCHFYPATQKNVNGSLMSLHFLDSVTQFCDDEDIPHNPFAPNPQNLRCDGKSTWQVISRHEDFRDSNPPRSKRSIPDLNPKFQVIQEQPKQKPRFILLLDLSGSMEMYMTIFYQEVVRFVRDLIPTGSQIAVVSFANVSRIDVDFTEVTNSNREDIVQRLPKTYTEGGYTAIGAAMITVLELVERSGITSEGLMVVLITDGEETIPPLVSKVLPDIKKHGIVINTVSLGPNATNNLELWASETGGRSYYHRTGYLSSASTLDALLLDSISKYTESSDELLQVYRDVVRVKAGESNFKEGEVTLDSSVGHLTKFSFTENIPLYNSFSIAVTLISPDGEIYKNTSGPLIYSEDPYTRTITFSLTEAKAGRWVYNITSFPPKHEYILTDDVLIAVTSYPRNKAPEEPIRVKVWMSANDIQYPEPAPVYALVSQGYSIVVNANVTAIVDPPTSDSAISLPLFDDGVGADVHEGDGIYSAYFTQFSGNGRYSLSAVVSTTNLTAKLLGRNTESLTIKPELPGSNAIRVMEMPVPENTLPMPADSVFHVKDLDPPTSSEGEGRSNKDLNKVSVEPFTRFTSGGIFKVNNFQPGDLQPPGRVTDLKVLSISLYEATVKLRWTSPGDDLYHGKASVVDLRYHDTAKIYYDFGIGHRINQTHLLQGNLKPLDAGAPHVLTVQMLERSLEDLENHAFFFCVRARDEVGNLGNISNVARAYFPFREYARNIKEEQRENAMAGLVVIIVIVIMIVAIAAFIAIVKLLHFRNKKKKRTQELNESGYRYYS
ncbi:calcium-activated chloride channel regulator 1-like isoform X3 [Macrobrachium rosenbergii]|uniref:calcium-activated chloride channel regulator 1-like isoform X3 n=1 Tax=Macrobrachium rosenbergii TaxID=79674 RepID=UPI0034D43924